MRKVYQIRDEYQLATEFSNYGRGDQFSMTGFTLLYQYYSEYADGLEIDGIDLDLDVIGICCEWCEYTRDELIADYGCILDDDGEGWDFDDLLKTLDHETWVLKDETADCYVVRIF